jgi:hypothetical protein
MKIDYTSEILPDETVLKLQTEGRKYAALSKLKERKEWYFGNFINRLWETLPDDMREEIRLIDFYAECSAAINSGVRFPVVGTSGETLRRWCEVARHYQKFPNLDTVKRVLSFDHFRVARSLALDETNNIASIDALKLAVEHEWTADEMRTQLATRTNADPQILEIRSMFPAWIGKIADPLARMNGNKAQAQYHLTEYVKLVEQETK